MLQNNFVVTIAREYGSGGRLIGRHLADLMNIDFYDKNIIAMTAEKSGLSEEFLSSHEQKKKRFGFLSNAIINSKSLPLSDQVYLAQSMVIQEAAEKGSCVIVGRCADYILRDHPCCVRVFIHAPLEEKIKRIRGEYKDNVADPAAFAAKMDKERAAHYNYMTLNKWDDVHNYDLVINSSVGIDEAARLIKFFIEEFLKNKNS